MELTVSQARPRLGELVTKAQDPREVIVLTRHGKRVAAIVSIPEVERIWKLQDEAWFGRRNPLTGKRRDRVMILPAMLVQGPKGTVVTRSEAAEQVREIQLTRAEERRILQEGGLEPVEDGEIGGSGTPPARPPWWRRLINWSGRRAA